jgi:RHS repeat-associated protein
MGNRNTKTSSGATANYSYNLNNNELQSDDQGNTWGYDANGNAITRDTYVTQDSLFYDYENRLKRVWRKEFSLPVRYDSVKYDYDGLGQRTRSLWITDTTRYTWDGLYPVVEWNNQGKLKQTFIYANGLLLGIVDSTVTTNKRYYVLHDGLGSSIAITDSAANIKRSLIYSDFGQTLVDTSASGTPTLNRLYAGYSWDGSPANFYWMKYRQTYDAGIGRFGQEDPIQQVRELRSCRGGIHGETNNNPQGLNVYNYVLNNAVNLRDPSGQFSIRGNCYGQELKIRSAVQTACDNLGSTITNPDLRKCIESRCKNAAINCKQCECEGKTGYYDMHHRLWHDYTINICMDTQGIWKYYGRAAIHEWAHSCGWQHGEDQGVPGDTGNIGE